ncbi:MAG: hypothetical protein LQ352_008370, partial [Teloschistes flavicans]
MAQSTAHKNSLERRVFGHHSLGWGRDLHFKVFFPFKISWHVASALEAYWNEVRMQVTNTALTPDNLFQDEHFKLHMLLQDGEAGAQVKLILEIFNLDGPVTREFVEYITVMMMEYTSRGFCGVFNAWMREEASSKGIWIVLRATGLQELPST